jgi:hypothetical protein
MRYFGLRSEGGTAASVVKWIRLRGKTVRVAVDRLQLYRIEIFVSGVEAGCTIEILSQLD